MLELKREDIALLSSKDYSILLFYAEGCMFCDKIKPKFKEMSETYKDQVGFFMMEANEGLEYYMKWAEDTEQMTYEKDEQGNTLAKPVLNEDGSPVMTKKIVFPSFYVHHKSAADDSNPYGFIGGFDGAVEQELEAVIGMILQASQAS